MHPAIKQGSKGTSVKLLQRYLHLKEDGIWGTLTTESFLQWQKSHQSQGIIPDGICGPKSWTLLETEFNSCRITTSSLTLKQGDAIPTNPDGSLSLSYATRRITDIILHCTATREGRDYTVADIKNWHTMPKSKGGRGWSDIGYHYVIYRDGSIHIGRNVNISGAHTTNHNANSIGIVYVGGCPSDTVQKAKDTRTPQQKESIKCLVTQLLKLYGLTKSNVHGHCEYAAKACPSFNMIDFRSEL